MNISVIPMENLAKIDLNEALWSYQKPDLFSERMHMDVLNAVLRVSLILNVFLLIA